MFLRKKTPAELWSLHREDFLKILASERKPLTHSQLSYGFVDHYAKKYYRFTKEVTMSLERFGKMQEYMKWMSAGISGTEFKMFLDAIDKVLLDGLGKHPNVVSIGAIIAEMKKRSSMVIHTELLYNFVAVQVVREDESPERFDNDVQMDKVKTFKEMAEKEGVYFFFHREELKKVSRLYNMSEEEWTKYWQESLIRQAALPEGLKAIASMTM